MLRFVRRFLILPSLLAGTLSVGSALACQEPLIYPVDRLVDSSLAVLHARVMQAKVLSLADLGIACEHPEDSVRCEVLEISLDVLEDFKGTADRFETIYAPVPATGVLTCNIAVLPGMEYVLFLQDYGGVIGPNPVSFMIDGRDSQDRLAELRDWKARQRKD